MSIAHSGYHRHGAYILEHADLYGFLPKESSGFWPPLCAFTVGKSISSSLERLIPETPEPFLCAAFYAASICAIFTGTP